MDFAPIWSPRMDSVLEGVELARAHGLLPFVPPPAYAERKSPEKVNYKETEWWALFRRLEGDVGDRDNDFCRDGCLFRKRFRLPFSDFYSIYETVRDEEWFGIEKDSKRIPPLPLKIMGTFRLLGRNLVYDDITEISRINAETMRCFFRGFTHAFSRRFYDEWMRQPQTTDELYGNERVYRSNGYVALQFPICCVICPQFVGLHQLLRWIPCCVGPLPCRMELGILREGGMRDYNVSAGGQSCHVGELCDARCAQFRLLFAPFLNKFCEIFCRIAGCNKRQNWRQV